MSSSPGRVLSSLVVALLSRPCVTDIRSTDLRITTSPQPTPCWFFLFPPLTCSHATGVFFCTPSACLVLGQLLCVCQLVASGTLKERGDCWTKKREGSSLGLCKHIGVSFFLPFCRSPLLSFSTAREKGFLSPIIVFLLFRWRWKECRCKVSFVCHALAFYITLERPVY